MAKYVIYENKETGEKSAHTAQYSKKDGEKKVGTSEGANADEALKAYESGEGGDDAEDDEVEDEGPRSLTQSREPSPEEVEEENERLRAEEEAKEDFIVMSNADGSMFVEGDEDSDPASKKNKAKAAKPEPEKEAEPVEVGKFRAKDAKEALAKAQGKFHDPAEGPQRGAQTP
jgi:hypothetical protein